MQRHMLSKRKLFARLDIFELILSLPLMTDTFLFFTIRFIYSLLLAFVQLFNPLDITGTETRFVVYVDEFPSFLFGSHCLCPAVFGKGPFAIQHDGVIVECIQKTILIGQQFVKLIFGRWKITRRKLIKECKA